jgi:hypothetical protein
LPEKKSKPLQPRSRKAAKTVTVAKQKADKSKEETPEKQVTAAPEPKIEKE